MNNTVVRALSGSVYVALIIATCMLEGIFFAITILLFFAIALKEAIQLLKPVGGIYTKLLWVFAVLFFGFITTNYIFHFQIPFKWEQLYMLLPLVLVYSVFVKPKANNKKALGNTLLVILYLAFPFMATINLALTDAHLVLDVFILLWANDTLAFVFGKWLGKHKLYERLSPKKTIEGFVGGLIGALIASVLISYFRTGEIDWLMAIVLGIIVSVAGTVGDLFESMLKRNAGVKDSGNIMPGHGGVLDRLDSYLIAVPFVYLYYTLFL